METKYLIPKRTRIWSGDTKWGMWHIRSKMWHYYDREHPNRTDDRPLYNTRKEALTAIKRLESNFRNPAKYVGVKLQRLRGHNRGLPKKIEYFRIPKGYKPVGLTRRLR